MGKYLPWPIAIPLAIASHFVLDALPHYGIDHKTRDSKKILEGIYYIGHPSYSCSCCLGDLLSPLRDVP